MIRSKNSSTAHNATAMAELIASDDIDAAASRTAVAHYARMRSAASSAATDADDVLPAAATVTQSMRIRLRKQRSADHALHRRSGSGNHAPSASQLLHQQTLLHRFKKRMHFDKARGA